LLALQGGGLTAQNAALQLGIAAAGTAGVDVPAAVEADGALVTGGPAGGVDAGGGRGSGGRRKAEADVEAPLEAPVVAAAAGSGDVTAREYVISDGGWVDGGVRKVTRGRGDK
jgi:hypothetical protein